MIQLATITGPIFSKDKTEQESFSLQLEFIGTFIEHFNQFLTRYTVKLTARCDNFPQFDEQVLVCITEVIRRIFSNYRLVVLASCPEFFVFLDQISVLTTNCLGRIVQNASTQEDDSAIMIALDELLEMWASLGKCSFLTPCSNKSSLVPSRL